MESVEESARTDKTRGYGGASLAESVTSKSTVRRCFAASWTCVLRSLDWRESLTCGLLPNNTLPALAGFGRAGPDTLIAPKMHCECCEETRDETPTRRASLCHHAPTTAHPCCWELSSMRLLRVVSTTTQLCDCSRATQQHACAQKWWDAFQRCEGQKLPHTDARTRSHWLWPCFAVCVFCSSRR